MSTPHMSKRSHGGEIVTIQCGEAANWLGAQYHLLQNSNCDVHTPYHHSTHFRRAGGDSNNEGTVWMPRVIALEASVGLDSVVATYGAQESTAASTQERALQQWRREQAGGAAAAGAGAAAGSKPKAPTRPKHWKDLTSGVLSYHSKSVYSLPNLYEGTSDFHLYEHGCALMSRESIHEEVLDRTRWFLEECDQPDGIHLLVEANSGWSGVGGTLLGLLRDEYERIPIFCVSTLLPPPKQAASGGVSFAAATPIVQSVLNASLLMDAATQLSTAYMPLTTHYWSASNASVAASLPADLVRSLAQGALYESSALLALQLHWSTASYRSHPRSLNLATALAGLTQSSQANILASKIVLGEQIEQGDGGNENQEGEQGDSRFSRNELRESSSSALSGTADASSSSGGPVPTTHTLPGAVPCTMLGHWHAYPAARIDACFEGSGGGAAAAAVARQLHATPGGSSVRCDMNHALTESVHVFGNTETLSHTQLRARMQAQPRALYRDVSGSSRLNMPPSFPVALSDLFTEGSVTSMYRCQSIGQELRRLGVWLCSLNRGAVITSSYAQREEGELLDSAPSFLLSEHRRKRVQGDVMAEKAEEFNLTFTQEQIEQISECGTSLQNLAELY